MNGFINKEQIDAANRERREERESRGYILLKRAYDLGIFDSHPLLKADTLIYFKSVQTLGDLDYTDNPLPIIS